MPEYTETDPRTGRTLIFRGPTKPSPAVVAAAFAKLEKAARGDPRADVPGHPGYSDLLNRDVGPLTITPMEPHNLADPMVYQPLEAPSRARAAAPVVSAREAANARRAPAAGRGAPPLGADEAAFQRYYANWAGPNQMNPNPDDPLQQYDYRAAFRQGIRPPPPGGHWPSPNKAAGHPNLIVGGFHTQTGERVPGTPRADEAELVRLGWAPEDAARLAQTPEPEDSVLPVMRPLAAVAAAGARRGGPDRSPRRQ
jgi:hypothetical protein